MDPQPYFSDKREVGLYKAKCKIKCTYEDCFKRFTSDQAMRKHKIKDTDHFYCKRCDVDCEDDMSYLIHQIVSAKHIACPECGAEFEGSSARDLHVDAAHRAKQVLNCVGCGVKLLGAASYVAHIGKNECEVITLEDYDRLRAEKQIEKDAWEAALDTQNVRYGDSSLASEAGTHGGAPLMDDDPRSISTDYRSASDLDSGLSPLQFTVNASQQSASNLASSITNLSIDKYPPLPAQVKPAKKENVLPKPTVINGDLLDFDEPETKNTPGQPGQNPGAWNSIRTASRRFSRPNEGKAYPSQSDLSGFASEVPRTTLTGATYGKSTHLSGSNTSTDRTPIPGTDRPVKNDPNLRFAEVQTEARVVPRSILNPMNYYDELLDKFVCTGKDCKRKFDTAEAFKGHLITGTHVGGRTQCPTCLRKFPTTWALISHCESASRKCKISKTANYNQILRELTSGLLGTEGHTESDVRYVAVPVREW